jgi:sugar/nucleoside kinase (ribokinase family)
MARTYDVLVAGSYSLDLIFTGLPKLPQLGEDIVASGFESIPGEAYNSAAAMHRLGLSVGWAGDFGNDDFSRFALEQAHAEGLDEALFVHHQRPLRRISIAASFPEDRAFITFYDPDPPLPAVIKALATASARVLYIPGFYYGAFMDMGIRLARARRMKIVMDGNSGSEVTLKISSVRKAVRSIDVLLPNAREARNLTGEDDLTKAIKILGKLCPLVVVKDGSGGAFACQGGEILHAEAIAVTPIETTGAGDCFNAGFLKAWLDGVPVQECLRWGNIVGGLSTLALGGTGKRVTVEEVNKWLAY